MEIDKAVVFAEREGYRPLELDIYRSSAVPPSRRRCVLYVHGGGWRVSHRSRAPRETRPWDRGFFERLTDAGFVVAASDYRFSSEATYPAQLDDVVEAWRWLGSQRQTLGLAADRRYVWGASAGGHLAALAGAAGRSDRPPGGRVLVPGHRHHPVRPPRRGHLRGAPPRRPGRASTSTWPARRAR